MDHLCPQHCWGHRMLHRGEKGEHLGWSLKENCWVWCRAGSLRNAERSWALEQRQASRLVPVAAGYQCPAVGWALTCHGIPSICCRIASGPSVCCPYLLPDDSPDLLQDVPNLLRDITFRRAVGCPQHAAGQAQHVMGCPLASPGMVPQTCYRMSPPDLLWNVPSTPWDVP